MRDVRQDCPAMLKRNLARAIGHRRRKRASKLAASGGRPNRFGLTLRPEQIEIIDR